MHPMGAKGREDVNDDAKELVVTRPDLRPTSAEERLEDPVDAVAVAVQRLPSEPRPPALTVRTPSDRTVVGDVWNATRSRRCCQASSPLDEPAHGRCY
jgi:hypothetical protein